MGIKVMGQIKGMGIKEVCALKEWVSQRNGY